MASAEPETAADDHSLELSAYAAAGIPDPAVPWDAEQYERAVGILVRTAAAGRQGLPRRFSARSGLLFARLVAVDDLQTEGAAPSGAQAEAAARSVALVSTLCGVYAPASDGADLTNEQIALVRALLSRLRVALERSRLRVAGDASWGASYEQQKRALQGVLHGTLAMLAENARYSASQRAELRSSLRAEQAALLDHLNAAERVPLAATLASATSD